MSIPSLLDLLELNHLGLNTNDMIVTLGTVGSLVGKHDGYRDQLPEEVGGAALFLRLAEELHQADQEAANKDTVKVAKKQEKHQEAAVALAVFGQFAIMRSIKRNSTSYIENLGFELKKKIGKKHSTNHNILGFPDPFAVRHGLESGELLFKMGAVKGAAHYDIYGCTGDPNDASSWYLIATFLNTRNLRIAGLEPGKVYMFRVRCLGATGYGPWSNIIKIMVV